MEDNANNIKNILELDFVNTDLENLNDINDNELDIEIQELEKTEQRFNELYETNKVIIKTVNEVKEYSTKSSEILVGGFQKVIKKTQNIETLINVIEDEVKTLNEKINDLELTQSKREKLEENILEELNNRLADKKSIIRTVIIFSILSSIISSSLVIAFIKFFT